MRIPEQPRRRAAARPSTVMASLRVEAPADADPHVLAAVVTRGICDDSRSPMSAEVTYVPAWRKNKGKRGLRRFGFIALLSSTRPANEARLVEAAGRAATAALRSQFGTRACVKARPADNPDELSVYWCSVRGTPSRMHG